jgi:hypothetical protein
MKPRCPPVGCRAKVLHCPSGTTSPTNEIVCRLPVCISRKPYRYRFHENRALVDARYTT